MIEIVAAARGVAPAMLLHRRRCRAEVALARQIAMYLMHVELSRQYLEVGAFFRRDRTTVAHACAVVEDLREDLAFDAEIDRLAALLDRAPSPAEVRRAS